MAQIEKARERRLHTAPLKPAGFLRAFALFFDCLFLGAAMVAFAILISGLLAPIIRIQQRLGIRQNLVFLIFFNLIHFYILVACLYKPMMEFLFGATIGGKTVGLGVIDGTGRLISLRAAFLRNLQYLLLFAPLWLLLLWVAADRQSGYAAFLAYYCFLLLGIAADAIYMLAHPRNRSLCDLLAGTYCCEIYRHHRTLETAPAGRKQ